MPMTSLWIEFVGLIFVWTTGIQSSSASFWISLVKAEVKTDGHVFSKETEQVSSCTGSPENEL